MPIREVLPDDFEKGCPVTEPGKPIPPCRRWFPVEGGYWSFGTPPDEERVSVLEVQGTAILVHAYANGPNAAAHMDAIDGLLATVEFLSSSSNDEGILPSLMRIASTTLDRKRVQAWNGRYLGAGRA
jgi:hypothetical protein